MLAMVNWRSAWQFEVIYLAILAAATWPAALGHVDGFTAGPILARKLGAAAPVNRTGTRMAAAAAAEGQHALSVTAHPSASGLAFLGFPSGTKVNGSFGGRDWPGANLFVTGSVPPRQVPAGSGNSNGPNNVEISGGTTPEFATTIVAGIGVRLDASVNVNPTGLVTYSVQWDLQGDKPSFIITRPNITLTSAAFLGCRLSPAGPNTFPFVIGNSQYNNTVTGSLQSNTLQLTAEFLINGWYLIDASLDAFWTASWQLFDCPAFPSVCEGGCCTADKSEVLPAGTPCSCCWAAASPCEQAAVCDGINPACPSNPWVRKETHCPWRPRNLYAGPYWQGAATGEEEHTEPSLEAMQVPAQTAAAWGGDKPDYARKWPECTGRCINGVCALLWDSPRCCYVSRWQTYHHYDADDDDNEGPAAYPTTTYLRLRSLRVMMLLVMGS